MFVFNLELFADGEPFKLSRPCFQLPRFVFNALKAETRVGAGGVAAVKAPTGATKSKTKIVVVAFGAYFPLWLSNDNQTKVNAGAVGSNKKPTGAGGVAMFVLNLELFADREPFQLSIPCFQLPRFVFRIAKSETKIVVGAFGAYSIL